MPTYPFFLFFQELMSYGTFLERVPVFQLSFLFIYFMFCPMAFLGGLSRFGVFVYCLSVIPMTVTEKKIRLDLLMYKVEYCCYYYYYYCSYSILTLFSLCSAVFLFYCLIMYMEYPDPLTYSFPVCTR